MKTALKRLWKVLGFGALLFFPFSGVLSQDSSLADSLNAHLYQQRSLFPQEKLYIHTDKPHYVCGERVWFRAYLVDAFTLSRPAGSRYVYAELLSPDGRVSSRVKVRERDSIFSGYIQLGDTLAEGNYTLRAYTLLMRDRPEYFFRKNVYISNPIQKSLKADASFTADGRKWDVRLWFTDVNKGIRLQPYRICLTQGTDTLSTKWDGTDSLYHAHVDMSGSQSPLLVRAGNFRQYLSLPSLPTDSLFDVSFFPEGGYLVGGHWCKVGFKALGSDGWSVPVSGTVYDSGGSEVASFSSLYKGMGSFHFCPESGHSYYAVCRTGSGAVRRFSLPPVSSSACVLAVTQRPNSFAVGVLQGAEASVSGATLVVHSRGEVYYAAPWNPHKQALKFSSGHFPSGLVQFLLLDSSGRPLSERLVFNRMGMAGSGSLVAGQPGYGVRTAVKARLKLRHPDGRPLGGRLSVSVTDLGVVRPDTCTSVYSSLLLTSELRGQIESPAYYFRDDSPLRVLALDALLLTQGWRRYDLPSAFQGRYAESRSPLELGQALSGSVLGGLRMRPQAGCQIGFASLDKRWANVMETDEEGRFCFEGFEFADSTRFYLQAFGKRGSEHVEISMDRDFFPAVEPALISRPLSEPDVDSYTHKTANFLSQETGMRNIWLDEVVKVAPKKAPDIMQQIASRTYDGNFFEQQHITTLMDFLQRVPGISIKKMEASGVNAIPGGHEQVRFKNVGYPVLVVIDGIPMNEPYFIGEEFDYGSVQFINVDHISVFRPSESVLFGLRGSGGVIDITTKKGNSDVEEEKQKNSLVFSPLGYQREATFYSPAYATAQQKASSKIDLRTTLYWNPAVELDAQGEATIEFYSADFATDYSIRVEGISEGVIVEQEETVEIVE